YEAQEHAKLSRSDDLPGHLVLPDRFFQITESSTHQGSTARPRLPLLIAWLLLSYQPLEVPPRDTRLWVLSLLHYGTLRSCGGESTLLVFARLLTAPHFIHYSLSP